VDVVENLESQGKQLTFGIDGEFYELRRCKRIMFQIDKDVPKLQILKRVNKGDKNPAGNADMQEVLTELKKSHNPTLF